MHNNEGLPTLENTTTRRSITKSALWATPAIATTVAAPAASAASGEANITWTIDQASATITLANSGDADWVQTSVLVTYNPFQYPFNFAPILVGGVTPSNPRPIDGNSRVIADMGAVTVEAGQTLVWQFTSRANTSNPAYVVNFTSGTYNLNLPVALWIGPRASAVAIPGTQTNLTVYSQYQMVISS
ncbi:MAG: hypothetical protein QM632_00105 [Micrococcaceae bacterium]